MILALDVGSTSVWAYATTGTGASHNASKRSYDCAISTVTLVLTLTR
jgi:hypothetical protein